MKHHIWRESVTDGITVREPVGVYRGDDPEAHLASLQAGDGERFTAEPVVTDQAIPDDNER